jgi:endonuclease/exonuclease/phosphatase family metal-dependent hydrolase
MSDHHPPPLATSSTSLRLLHWNVHSWQDPDGNPNVNAVAELITQLRPHVVSLVEVDEPWGQPTSLQEVADATGYTWLFTPSFEFGTDTPRGGFGNALLTTLPVLAFQQWNLLWPPPIYDSTEPSEQRSIALARLDHDGHPIWTGTTHAPRNSTRARTQARRRWLDLTDSLVGPWVLAGDFNEPANAWTTEQHKLNVSPPDSPTYPTAAPAEPIDYYLASEDLHLEAHTLPALGSDHLPVIASAHLGNPGEL